MSTTAAVVASGEGDAEVEVEVEEGEDGLGVESSGAVPLHAASVRARVGASRAVAVRRVGDMTPCHHESARDGSAVWRKSSHCSAGELPRAGET